MLTKRHTKQEIILTVKGNKSIHHYQDSEYNIDVKSRITYKNKDLFTVYPFWIDKRSRQVKPRYPNIHAITFEGMNNKLPPGFSSIPAKGYKPTKQLKPFLKLINANTRIKELVISKTHDTKIQGSKFIIAYSELNRLRQQIGAAINLSSEQTKTISNNFLALHFPEQFISTKNKYQKNTIMRIFDEYEAVEKNLSNGDRDTLLAIFEKVSSSRENLLNKKQLITTKQKIEIRFIEDVLTKYKNLMSRRALREGKWQDFFKENAWIFSQLFSYPTVLFEDQAYVGGKTVHNKEGKIVDFLYKNKLTNNSALIEIKTHNSKLLDDEPYRGQDVFPMHKDLAGSISQILDQKENYCRKFDSIRPEQDLTPFDPKCIIVIGKISNLAKKQLKSFELIRANVKEIDIVTFDELFNRITSVLHIFKSVEKNTLPNNKRGEI